MYYKQQESNLVPINKEKTGGYCMNESKKQEFYEAVKFHEKEMLKSDDFEREFRKEVDYNRQYAYIDTYEEDWDKYCDFKLLMNNLRLLKRTNQSAYERELKKYIEKKAKVNISFEKRKNRESSAKTWAKKQKEYRDMMREADNKSKYIPITIAEKKQLAQNFTEEERINYKELLEKRFSLFQKKEEIIMDTLNNAYDYICKVNLFTILELDEKLGCDFSCILFKGYWASINQQNGYYKYFTKTSDKKTRIVLGLIDIVEIVYDCNFTQAIITTCRMLNIKVHEVDWIIEQVKKYQCNLDLLRNNEYILKMDYSALHKYINKHLYLLVELNRIGLEHILSLNESVGEESVFFVSTRFLQDKLKEKGYIKKLAIITSTINMFCVLGLVNKVQGNMIPDNLRERAVEEKGKKGNNFMVSFYVVPKITEETLEVAEDRANLLKSAKVSATMVSQDTVRKVFGEDVWKTIYNNTYYWADEIKKKKKEAKENKAKEKETKEKETKEKEAKDKESQKVYEEAIITNSQSNETEFSDIPF